MANTRGDDPGGIRIAMSRFPSLNGPSKRHRHGSRVRQQDRREEHDAGRRDSEGAARLVAQAHADRESRKHRLHRRIGLKAKPQLGVRHAFLDGGSGWHDDRSRRAKIQHQTSNPSIDRETKP